VDTARERLPQGGGSPRQPHRDLLNAATMLGQSKTAHQAEIDAACELVDFLPVQRGLRAAHLRPSSRSPRAGTWNRPEPRPLEGFVFAATPFNFTAIAGNLPTAPALMGNTVVWKPSRNALYSAHYILQLLREAGLPEGVINLVIGPPGVLTDVCLDHPDLAGVHFTGDTACSSRCGGASARTSRIPQYPRIVGETGGKDFVFAHKSADVRRWPSRWCAARSSTRGRSVRRRRAPTFLGRSGPRCARRWRELTEAIRVGDVADFRNFMGAVIDARAFARLSDAIDRGRSRRGLLPRRGRHGRRSRGALRRADDRRDHDPQHA
jgi:1-pyrroline-5-carboxylate dehydrogenase